MDMRDLPRVDLQGLIDGGYEPVIVQGGENAFIVMAPPGEDTGKQLATVRSRAGLGPGRKQSPTTASFEPPSDVKIGVGAESANVRVTSRVDMAQGTGVGLGAPVPGFGSELGSAVPSPFTSWMRREYNRDLYGIKGLQLFDRMRKSDGTVRGTLRLAKTPVLAGQYSVKPATTSTRDQTIADFVWKNLTEWMTTSWPQLLTEALLMLDFGYYMFEKVFAPGEHVTNDPDARGKIVWQKLAPRHPMDVKEWFFDLEGGPLSVDMWATSALSPSFENASFQGYAPWVNIPINKLLVFTFDKEAGNIEGISLLRSAYKHWYYKDNLYKIDAIQKERHGIGVPVIQLPVGYGDNDLKLADQLGRNLRTNDRAHVVLPPNWTLSFAELRGQPVDCIRSIEHHDTSIEKQILGQFLTTAQKTDEADQTLFLKATRFTADIVTDTINSWAIPQLVDMNWTGARRPKLVAKRIGEQEDWRTMSFTLRNLVGAGVIVPDQPLEDHIREELGYPPADPATSRLIRSTENRNVAQPAPSELPGTPADIQAAFDSGQITAQQYLQMLNQSPTDVGKNQGQQAGLPRQASPDTVTPSTGRGDNSGTSGRRGQ